MMDRRAFVQALAGVALLSPMAAAETPLKARRIGLLMSTTPLAASHIVAAFADGLRELGHVEGENVVFEGRRGEGEAASLAGAAARATHPVVPNHVRARPEPRLPALVHTGPAADVHTRARA